jgi:hypothetical protein
MRPLILAAALAVGSTAAAQQKPASSDSTPHATSSPIERQQLDSQLQRLRGSTDAHLPTADHFSFGDHSVPAGTTVDGPIAVARGSLEVFGTVNGDAYVIDGDIRVHKGARITGDAVSAGGQVIIDGGAVEGERRSLTARQPTERSTASRAPLGTWQSVKLVIGWFALLMIIGLGVMIFADANLDGVVIGLERGFARSFWIGIAGQVAALPVLLLLVVALAITILGALLIPFAVVSYVIATAGLVTLGFLAIARLTGGALTSDSGATSPRGVHLRALFIGLFIYLGIWLIAAAFTWNPVAGSVLRAIAIAITWVAATAGLGAALSSRGGTQRPGVGATARAPSDDLAWQTPTPVSGVAAARRPVSPSVRES